MTKKEVLRLLAVNGITSVMVGGLALRMYNSPRVTIDMDLAISPLDIDAALTLMYSHGFLLITGVDKRVALVESSPEAALTWAERTKPGSLTLVQAALSPSQTSIPLDSIDITTEVDFLFDLAIPFPRLKQHARMFPMDNFTILVASIHDLLILKESRQDKSSADITDIRFLKDLLGSEDSPER
jgi:hypothetical protein